LVTILSDLISFVDGLIEAGRRVINGAQVDEFVTKMKVSAPPHKH